MATDVAMTNPNRRFDGHIFPPLVDKNSRFMLEKIMLNRTVNVLG